MLLIYIICDNLSYVNRKLKNIFFISYVIIQIIAIVIKHALYIFCLLFIVDTHGLTPVALVKEVCIDLEGCMPSNSL